MPPTRSTRKRAREETPPAPPSPSTQDEEEEEEDSDEAAGSPSTSPIPAPPPMKKRRGRPPRSSYASLPGTPQNLEGVSTGANSPAAVGTPGRDSSPGSAAASPAPGHTPGFRGRRRGRAPWGGGSTRGNKRASLALTPQAANGQNVIDDEVVLETDPIGESKVSKNGELLGGREYRCRTFTLLNRGDRLYMLSTEPARCIGFRDSYLFFQKHKNLFKIIANEEEKFDLISRNIIPHSYKGRAIGVLTARSVFREFGARIVVGGRRVTDDYDEKSAREAGFVEGELADPDDRLPPPGQEYNRNQYVAWHGASAVYHTSGPAVPEVKERSTGGIFGEQKKKKKVALNDNNWMYQHAQAASDYNSILLSERRNAQEGVFEAHTNMQFYPQNFQPTVAKWERVSRRLPPADDPQFRSPSPEPTPLVDDVNGATPVVNGAGPMPNGKLLPNGNSIPRKKFTRNVHLCVDTMLVTPMQTFSFGPGFDYDKSAKPIVYGDDSDSSDDEETPAPPNHNASDAPDAGLGPGLIGWGDSGFGGGIKDVDPSIYEHLPDHIKLEIKRQVNREKRWEKQWAGGETANGMREPGLKR